MRGLFITFEGPDASGKTTQLKLLEDYFNELKLDFIMTREPGGTPISERIREIILDKECSEMLPVTEALLYAASRAQHVGEKIIPALDEGKIVISDRFLDSSIAYQGYGRGMGEMIRSMNEPAISGIMPDITILLKIDPELMKTRRESCNEDRMDAQKLSFHKKVLEGYMALAEVEPQRIAVVDACCAIEEVAENIRKIVEPLLRNKGYIV